MGQKFHEGHLRSCCISLGSLTWRAFIAIVRGTIPTVGCLAAVASGARATRSGFR